MSNLPNKQTPQIVDPMWLKGMKFDWNKLRDFLRQSPQRGDNVTTYIDQGTIKAILPTSEQVLSDIEDIRGINLTFETISNSTTFDKLLDDTRDYRGRHIECWIETKSGADSTDPSVGQEFLNMTLVDGVTLATDPPYTVYVDNSDGSLNVSATEAGFYYVVIWIRTSARSGAPLTCPVDPWLPSSWPFKATNGATYFEDYAVTNNYTSPEAGADVICWRYEEYASADCSGAVIYWEEGRIVGDDYLTAKAGPSCVWEHITDPPNVQYPHQTRTSLAATWADSLFGMGEMYLSGGRWNMETPNNPPNTDVTLVKTVGDTPTGTFVQNSCDGGGGTYVDGSANSARVIGSCEVNEVT